MRIVTRPDFDGIVCAVLLSDVLDISTPIKWVEPYAMQHSLVEIMPGDIIANLAYHPECSLWFDHHESNRIAAPFNGTFKIAPSAAGIVFEYFNAQASPTAQFSRDYSQLVEETDKIDSAALSLDEVINPNHYPYVALATTIHSHNQTDESYWNLLVKLLKARPIEQVLKHREVKKRVLQARQQDKIYHALLEKYTRLIDHVTITDFRSLPQYLQGNRFLVFSLFPQSVVNLKVRYEDPDQKNVILSIGHSIFNRNCQVSAGELSGFFGGGGHRGAGSCNVPAEQADEAIATIVDILLKNQPASFPILFEDNDLIAVNKPAGLLSEGNHVVKYQGELLPVFPLEREISGIVLFAKSHTIKEALWNMANHGQVQWMSFSLVEGLFPDRHKTIPLGEPEKFPALTHFDYQCHLINTPHPYSLLTIESPLPQNRDIREQLSKSGFPIAGDVTHHATSNPLNRLCLHVYFITFIHPVTGERVVIETPLPRTFLTVGTK